MKSPYYLYRKNELIVENVPVREIARRVGTPFYLYSHATMADAFRSYETAFAAIPHVICYSLKANSNLAVAAAIAKLGGGVDIVSGGELKRALDAGFRRDNIIFSGVGKTRGELAAAIQSRIRMINVESPEELKALNEAAASLKKPAPFSLRVNPDVRAGGHPHISTGTPENKFGVYHKNIFPLYQWARRQPYLKPVGIQSHIGSQITRVAPYRKALTVLLDLVRDLDKAGVAIEILDLGGGLGVAYDSERPDSPADLAKIVLPALRGQELTLFLEPGRSLVAQAGMLVTQVLYRKDAGSKHFIIVDAAMNDLARPALYDAYHEIIPVKKKGGKRIVADVVGPVCESSDYLAKERPMILPKQGDLLAVLTAGAYGFSMSSQYNSRPRLPEVLVAGGRFDIVRTRENYRHLIQGESIPGYLKVK